MQRLVTLESKTIPAGGNVQVSLRDLPAGAVLRALYFCADVQITQAAGSAAITEEVLYGLLTNCEIGKRIRVTGRMMQTLYWLMYGREFDELAGLPGGVANFYRRAITWVLPFGDPYALKFTDTCPRTEWFKDTPAVLDFLSPATFDANDSLTSGTLRTYALVEEVDSDFVPATVQIGYTDWSGQQPVLESGCYSHLFLFKDHNVAATAYTFTSAEITSASVTVDSTPVVTMATVSDLARRWNIGKCDSQDRKALSATAPVPGGILTAAPVYTAGGAATVTTERVPLVFPDRDYKITDLWEARSALSASFQGSLTSFRLGWRRIEKRSGEATLRAFAKAGNPQDPAAVFAKTASKKDLPAAGARWFPFLPNKGAKK